MMGRDAREQIACFSVIVSAMDNDMLGRAAVSGRRGAWGHAPSLQTASVIIWVRDNSW